MLRARRRIFVRDWILVLIAVALVVAASSTLRQHHGTPQPGDAAATAVTTIP